MYVELNEREISLIQCALYCAKEEYLEHAKQGPEIKEQFELQARESMALYDKLENL